MSSPTGYKVDPHQSPAQLGLWPSTPTFAANAAENWNPPDDEESRAFWIIVSYLQWLTIISNNYQTPTQTLGSPYIGIFLVDGGRSLLGAAIGAWCKLMDGVSQGKRYLRQNRFVEAKLRIAYFYILSQENTISGKFQIEFQSMKKSLTRSVIVFNDSSEPLERNCK